MMWKKIAVVFGIRLVRKLVTKARRDRKQVQKPTLKSLDFIKQIKQWEQAHPGKCGLCGDDASHPFTQYCPAQTKAGQETE